MLFQQLLGRHLFEIELHGLPQLVHVAFKVRLCRNALVGSVVYCGVVLKLNSSDFVAALTSTDLLTTYRGVLVPYRRIALKSQATQKLFFRLL